MSPLIRSFGIALFILVLMFVARYKGDLIGKGLEFGAILKIFFYASIAQIVLALPVSVLLSSLFAMGNFGENYELAAMRSSGLSMPQILRPMAWATIVATVFSFFMFSYVVPWSNLKLYSLLYDIQQLKPAFSLKPGHFNTAIDNYVIRIEEKDVSTDMLYGVMIYDHTGKKEDSRLVVADSASMKVDPYGRYMNMTLYNGVSYESIVEKHGIKEAQVNYLRFYFNTLLYNFDISGFALERTEEAAFSSHQYMLTYSELHEAIDSIEGVKDNIVEMYGTELAKVNHLDTAFLQPPPDSAGYVYQEVLLNFPKRSRMRIMQSAIDKSRQVTELSKQALAILDMEDLAKRERLIEVHMKYALPMACMVFLFIGAPLGAIIRKGGVGIPIMFSIFMYLTFNVLMIQGKKMAIENVLPVWTGVWLPVLVFMPVAIFFTFQSTVAGGVLSLNKLWKIRKFIFRFIIWMNPLYWLWKVPVIQKVVIAILGPIVRLFPDRGRKKRGMRRS